MSDTDLSTDVYSDIGYADLPEILTVTVRTPDSVVFHGECSALIAENTLGPFGVYPGHQNFITNITGFLKLQSKGSEQMVDYFINMGILRVFRNTVHVYIMLYSPVDVLGRP